VAAYFSQIKKKTQGFPKFFSQVLEKQILKFSLEMETLTKMN